MDLNKNNIISHEIPSFAGFSILIFGEVLFDVFPSGEEKIGGAPFNIACHLKGLGLEPLFISSIGQDERGEKTLKFMDDWHLNKSGVSISKEFPTGVVKVFFDENGPTFDIPFDQAFDHININISSIFDMCIAKKLLLYHGSLALRNRENANVLNNIKEKLIPKIFIDVNLRMPWWEKDNILQLVRQANWLKLNDIEFNHLFSDSISKLALYKACLMFNLNAIIVTKGEKGAEIYTRDGIYLKDKSNKKRDIIDTVGAGDAFAAIFIYGLVKKWDYKTMLCRAVEFAADICSIRGALPSDVSFYNKYLDKWGKGNE